MKYSGLLQAACGILIASAGLYIFFRDVDSELLIEELESIPFYVVGVCILLSLLTLYLRSLRWSLFLPRSEVIHKKNLFSHTIIGYMLNNIFPARLGEIGRAFLLWRDNGAPAALCAGSLIIERVIDVMVFLLFFIIPVFLLERLFFLKPYARVGIGLIVFIITVVLFYLLFPSVAGSIGKKLAGFLPASLEKKFSEMAVQALSSISWIFSIKKTFLVFLLSCIIPACYVTMIVLISSSEPGFGLIQALFIMAWAAAGSAVPLSPGYIGTVHAASLQGYLLLGADINNARAYTILFHAATFLPVTLAGFIYFLKAKISLKEIRKKGGRLKQS